MLKLAVVILNWNGKDLLEKYLPFVIKYSAIENVKIYLADNASADNSVNFVKKNYPTIQIIQNKENGGFAKGYNEALKQIKADIFCLLNSDIEVTENWLQPILTTFKKEKETVIIQPKILDYKNKLSFEYAGAAGGFMDKYGYPFCRGRMFNTIEKDNGQYNDIKEIFWASGACFFIRSKTYFELHGFDEDYFAHQEEIDLCWRAQNLNKKIKYVGNSTIYHVGGATLEETNPKKTFLNFRNSLFTLVKNLPKKSLFPIIFTRLILDGIAGIKFLLELKPMHTFAIIKAHFSFYKNLSKMLKKRNGNNQKTDYYIVKNVVWNYFILSKRKFEDFTIK